MDNAKKYRSNVGIMIINRDHKILAGEAFHYPGEWMMPQGGVDESESLLETVQRELLEETGLQIQQLQLIREHDEWLHYLFPKPQYKDDIYYVGQRQKWFLFEYHGPLPDANGQTEQEFSCFDWVSAPWLIERAPPFKRNVYKTIVAAFSPFLPT